MADNATLPATGTVVAADDIAGVLHQRVKISVGAEGAAADLAPGRAAAAASIPTAWSTEDLAALNAIGTNTAASATETTADAIATNTDRTADAVETMAADTSTMPMSQDTAVVKNGATSLTPKFGVISSTGSGDTLALVSGKKIRVLSMFFVVAAATTVKFQTGATTDLTGAMSYAANDGIALAHNPLGWFETTSGAKLNHVLGTSVGIAGGFTYVEV